MNLGPGEAASTGSEPDAGASTARTPGALLEQERKRQGLSIREAAEGLHLDTWIIEAIETNRFQALGAPVYAKGYLRKYAELLGLAPESIVASYEALTDTLPEPTPVPVTLKTAPALRPSKAVFATTSARPKWPKYVAWLLLTALAIGIGVAAFVFVWPEIEGLAREGASIVMPSSEPVRSTTAEPAPQASVPAVAPAGVDSGEAAVDTRDSEEVATRAPAAASSDVDAASAEPALRLTLAFDAPSWVEVQDAAGRRLMYDIGQAGRVYNVEGTPPLEVVIGVAAAVKIRANDREIIVPRRANRDSTRFVVEADGSVR